MGHKEHWKDHNIIMFKNKKTGKCIIVDDDFWGSCGSMYDPLKVSPPLMSKEGEKSWNYIRGMCEPDKKE